MGKVEPRAKSSGLSPIWLWLVLPSLILFVLTIFFFREPSPDPHLETPPTQVRDHSAPHAAAGLHERELTGHPALLPSTTTGRAPNPSFVPTNSTRLTTAPAPTQHHPALGSTSASLPTNATSEPSPVTITPEWEKLEPLLRSRFAEGLRKLTNATTEIDLLYAFNDMAKLSMAAGLKEAAAYYAKELLALDQKTNGQPWKGSDGQALHDANIVLGRLAVEEGRLEEGKEHLLAAGQASGSPSLSSFGPNMTLAKALLEAGEQETVLQYFESCRKFWPNEKLSEWSILVQAGRIPDFGPNLLY